MSLELLLGFVRNHHKTAGNPDPLSGSGYFGARAFGADGSRARFHPSDLPPATGTRDSPRVALPPGPDLPKLPPPKDYGPRRRSDEDLQTQYASQLSRISPEELAKADLPGDPGQRPLPADPGQRPLPADSGPTSLPADLGPTSLPADPGPRPAGFNWLPVAGAGAGGLALAALVHHLRKRKRRRSVLDPES